MTENLPYQSVEHKGLTIEGYSRAAVQSYWRVPEMKVGFDLGAQPWSFMGTPNWFVSHAHLDHIVALPVYVSRRRMMKMDPPTIYMPGSTIEPMQQILFQFSRLDRGRLPCKMLPIRPGDEVDISREHVVTVHKTVHSIESLGFIAWERRRKLKQEYQDLSGPEIRDLRLTGTEVTDEHRMPRVAYLGDSVGAGLDNNPAMYEAEVLILEMTFVTPEHRKEQIDKFGHMHLDDIVARRDLFKNDLIIATHFSTRYHPNQIKHHVQRAFPDMLDGRLQLWI